MRTSSARSLEPASFFRVAVREIAQQEERQECGRFQLGSVLVMQPTMKRESTGAFSLDAGMFGGIFVNGIFSVDPSATQSPLFNYQL